MGIKGGRRLICKHLTVCMVSWLWFLCADWQRHWPNLCACIDRTGTEQEQETQFWSQQWWRGRAGQKVERRKSFSACLNMRGTRTQVQLLRHRWALMPHSSPLTLYIPPCGPRRLPSGSGTHIATLLGAWLINASTCEGGKGAETLMCGKLAKSNIFCLALANIMKVKLMPCVGEREKGRESEAAVWAPKNWLPWER